MLIMVWHSRKDKHCPDSIMSHPFWDQRNIQAYLKFQWLAGDLLSAFIALIFSRVTFKRTNTGNVPTPPVLRRHERKVTRFTLYVHINNLVLVLPCTDPHECYKMPIKGSLNLPIAAASVYSSHQWRSSALAFTDAYWRPFCHVVCFSLPPFHVYAAVMIINRNIKASGAILVCNNPHTLVSTTLTCRCHGNAGDVITSPHPADIESRCMSSPAYSDMLTIISAFQLLYKKGVPSREKALQKPCKHTNTHTHLLCADPLTKW